MSTGIKYRENEDTKSYTQLNHTNKFVNTDTSHHMEKTEAGLKGFCIREISLR